MDLQFDYSLSQQHYLARFRLLELDIPHNSPKRTTSNLIMMDSKVKKARSLMRR
jgi:hypothetical protein